MTRIYATGANFSIDGILYISASEAAREIGVTAAYVARLARTNMIPGHQIGGVWYVDQRVIGERGRWKQRKPVQ